MFGDVPITIVGNLADDPELRYTPGGKAVTKFRVAVNARTKKDGRWVDGLPSFYTCVAWEDLAENIAQSLPRGTRVIVTGSWAQTAAYTDRNGSTVYPWELRVEAVGPDLRYASCKVSKMERASTGGTPTGGSEPDPWATSPGQAQGVSA